MPSVSAVNQVVASVSASDRRTWHSTHLLSVMFATYQTSPSVAVFIGASFWANVPNGRMLIGKGYMSNWSMNSIRWHLLSISCSINDADIMSNNSYRKSGLRQPVPQVPACWALFRCTYNSLHFVEVIFSDPYAWTSIVGQIFSMFCFHNWWDYHSNSSSTMGFAEFEIFSTWKAPLIL